MELEADMNYLTPNETKLVQAAVFSFVVDCKKISNDLVEGTKEKIQMDGMIKDTMSAYEKIGVLSGVYVDVDAYKKGEFDFVIVNKKP
jgi:hypothetical protein